jgi:hypothetical protein
MRLRLLKECVFESFLNMQRLLSKRLAQIKKNCILPSIWQLEHSVRAVRFSWSVRCLGKPQFLGKHNKMENKLYVGNLPYSITEEELGSMFAEAGNVKSAVIITDRETGRSKGFGFVEMETEAEAQSAIDRFHGVELARRPLTVNVARPREERSEGGGFRGGDRRGGGGYGGRRSGFRGGRN